MLCLRSDTPSGSARARGPSAATQLSLPHSALTLWERQMASPCLPSAHRVPPACPGAQRHKT